MGSGHLVPYFFDSARGITIKNRKYTRSILNSSSLVSGIKVPNETSKLRPSQPLENNFASITHKAKINFVRHT